MKVVLWMSILALAPTMLWSNHTLKMAVDHDSRLFQYKTTASQTISANGRLTLFFAMQLPQPDLQDEKQKSVDFGWDLFLAQNARQSITYGNMKDDVRFAPLFSTGFNLAIPNDTSTLRVKPVNREEESMLVYSNRLGIHDKIHAFALLACAEGQSNGIGIVGDVFATTGRMFFGALRLLGNSIGEAPPYIRYASYPIQNGVTAYVSFSARDDGSVSIVPSCTLRYGRDADLGDGTAVATSIQGHIGALDLTIEQSTVGRYLGAVGKPGFRTVDAPLSQYEIFLSQAGSRYTASYAIRDRRYRLTPFAGETARRLVTWEAGLFCTIGDLHIYATIKQESTWNRSNTRSYASTLKCSFTRSIENVQLVVIPSMKWKDDITYSLTASMIKTSSKTLSSLVNMKLGREGPEASLSIQKQWGSYLGKISFSSDRTVTLSVANAQ